jgi:hypothetical protein
MRRLRLGTAGLAVAVSLLAPRPASAGMGDVIDVILGLRGPQMVGIPMACEVILEEPKQKACYVAGFPVPWPKPGVDDDFWQSRDYWVSFGGGVYSSTGKDSDNGAFEAYDTWMLTLEPTLNIRSFGRNRRGNFKIEHGVGPSLFFLFGSGVDGKDFDSFANGGIKVKPVGLAWRNIWKGVDLGAAYNLRIFHKEFTAQDFGGDPGPATDTGREYVQGFSISISF